MSTPQITVIIPTTGLAARERALRQAVESVLDQRLVDAQPLVVLNGNRFSPDVKRWLESERYVRLIELEVGNLPAALRAGRAAVDTPFFATLDDDDFLLPDAMVRRFQEFDKDPHVDVVVTNGIIRGGESDALHIPRTMEIDADPLRALLERNWLLPGSWLGRTERIPVYLFDGMPRYLECTYLAVRFATDLRMRWVQEPTIVYRSGTPSSLSRSRAYVLGQAEALRRILTLRLPPDVRRSLQLRIAAALHTAADRDLLAGLVRDAWRWHVRSLRARGGWRYFPFTVHLLRATVLRRA